MKNWKNNTQTHRRLKPSPESAESTSLHTLPPSWFPDFGQMVMVYHPGRSTEQHKDFRLSAQFPNFTKPWLEVWSYL